MMTPRALLAFFGVTASLALLGATSDDGELTAVNAKVFNGYVRLKQPNGTFQPETFLFVEGGPIQFDPTRGSKLSISTYIYRSDSSIDGLRFRDLVKMLAGPLAKQNYVASRDLNAIQLMIVVYWGTTVGTDSPDWLPSVMKDRLNAFNADLLGFEDEARLLENRAYAFPAQSARIVREAQSAQIDAIAENRYYVILRAFDFRAAWKEKKPKLLWETRFSFFDRGHRFDKDLPVMARNASSYFGQESHGLVRPPERRGHAELGELEVVGTLEDLPDPNPAESTDPLSTIAGDWQGTTAGGLRVFLHIEKSGAATVARSSDNRMLPARVVIHDQTVTVTLTDQGEFFHGTIDNASLTGTMTESGVPMALTLSKTTEPGQGDRATR